MNRYRITLWLLSGLPLTAAQAQDDCFPSRDSHEARTFAILSVPLAFAAGGSMGGGTFVGVEAASLPQVPAELATPTSCRPGKGPENTNPLPGFVRLRVAFAMASWRVEAGWIPPVRVEGVRASLVGVAVERTVPLGRRWQVTPRLHALLGSLRAPVTCADPAVVDPDSECFGGARSDDQWRPGIRGADLRVAHRGSWLTPHGGIGYNRLRPRFQVHFTNALGSTDRRRVSVDLDRLAVFGGVTAARGVWLASVEGYATLGDRLAIRFLMRHRIGGR